MAASQDQTDDGDESGHVLCQVTVLSRYMVGVFLLARCLLMAGLECMKTELLALCL